MAKNGIDFKVIMVINRSVICNNDNHIKRGRKGEERTGKWTPLIDCGVPNLS